MTASAPLLVGLFGVALVSPFTLSVKELKWPRDKLSLSFDDEYVRNPRQFALALRDRIAPHLSEGDGQTEIVLRYHERFTVHPSLSLPTGEHVRGIIVVRGDLNAAEGVSLGEAWVQGEARVGAGAAVRGLASDANVHLGPRARVGRWVDAERDLYADPACDLGVSASAGGMMTLAGGCTFRRLWGHPVRTLGTPPTALEPSPARSIEDEMVWAGDELSIPPGAIVDTSIVAHGTLRIGSRAIVRGTMKADKGIIVGDGAIVEGNVISRGSVSVGRGARIKGHVFAERDVVVGAGAWIGQKGSFKTVYAVRKVTLGAQVSVFGWVVADRAGQVDEDCC